MVMVAEEEEGGGEGVMTLAGVVCCVWVGCERRAQGGLGGKADFFAWSTIEQYLILLGT
jgi:hypothetical protein